MLTTYKDQIQELETAAGKLGSDKEALYDLLVKAYYIQKDIITVLETQQPKPEIIEDKDALNQLRFNFDELEKTKNEADANLIEAMDKLKTIKQIVG